MSLVMQGCMKYGGLLSVLIKKLHGGKKKKRKKNIFIREKKKKGKDRTKTNSFRDFSRENTYFRATNVDLLRCSVQSDVHDRDTANSHNY